MYAPNEVIDRFVKLSAEVLKENLTGVYLHGSAVMGCYHPATSDLDFIVVIIAGMTDESKRGFMNRLFKLDSETPGKGIEMSIVKKDACNPFVYPTPFELHYSRGHTEWYQNAPEDYIEKMNGADRDLAAHFTVIRRRGKCLYGLPIEQAFGKVSERDYVDSIWYDIASAREEIEEYTMYLTLNLSRVLAYLKEKAVLSKKEGAQWGLKVLPEKYRPLICEALKEYETGADVINDKELAKSYASYMLEQISAVKEHFSNDK